jgi:hypothetical protein
MRPIDSAPLRHYHVPANRHNDDRIELAELPQLNTRASFLCFALVFMFANIVRAETSLPAPTTEGGSTTSDTCRACHPGPYESWRNSFHRTMTQAIEPNVVLGDFSTTPYSKRAAT